MAWKRSRVRIPYAPPNNIALTTLVRYDFSVTIITIIMTTLTIRIDENLKSKAAAEAYKLGIPLTLIVKNALKTFVESPKIFIGEPETIIVTPEIQLKMDKVGELLSKK